MITITINPSTFSYICSEYTIHPGFVVEHDEITVHFKAEEDKKAEAKLREFIEENF